jgi:hypothetical protein
VVIRGGTVENPVVAVVNHVMATVVVKVAIVTVVEVVTVVVKVAIVTVVVEVATVVVEVAIVTIAVGAAALTQMTPTPPTNVPKSNRTKRHHSTVPWQQLP